MSSIYHNIIRSFPKGYSLAFAYGSGVFKQLGQKNSSKKMMDFIFVVNDPLKWHRENIKRNARHYSALRFLGAANIESIQSNWGAKMYYNTLVPTHEGLIKYGVISRSAFIADLLDWESMYVAGRLQKPVLMLHEVATDREVQKALKVNLYSALHTSLLLLPETFTEEQLYTTITGLSYAGDFRMHVGEDSNKVANIVGAQLPEFRTVYKPLLDTMKDCVVLDWGTGQGMQDLSPTAKYNHLDRLPSKLQLLLVKECNRDGRSRDLEDVLRAAANDDDAEDMILTGVSNIVRYPAIVQAAKGILTAGVLKACRYSMGKVRKMLRSRWKR